MVSGDGYDGGPSLTSCRLTPDHRMLQVSGVDASLNLLIHRLTAVHATKVKTTSISQMMKLCPLVALLDTKLSDLVFTYS